MIIKKGIFNENLVLTGMHEKDLDDSYCADGFFYDPKIQSCIFVSQDRLTYHIAKIFCLEKTYHYGHMLAAKTARIGNAIRDNKARYP